jgi:hypothetical protein
VAAKRRLQTIGHGLDIEVKAPGADVHTATAHLSPGAGAMQRLIDPTLLISRHVSDEIRLARALETTQVYTRVRQVLEA